MASVMKSDQVGPSFRNRTSSCSVQTQPSKAGDDSNNTWTAGHSKKDDDEDKGQLDPLYNKEDLLAPYTATSSFDRFLIGAWSLLI